MDFLCLQIRGMVEEYAKNSYSLREAYTGVNALSQGLSNMVQAP